MCVHVHVAERRTALGKDWHPTCLKCECCERLLSPGGLSEVMRNRSLNTMTSDDVMRNRSLNTMTSDDVMRNRSLNTMTSDDVMRNRSLNTMTSDDVMRNRSLNTMTSDDVCLHVHESRVEPPDSLLAWDESYLHLGIQQCNDIVIVSLNSNSVHST